MSYRDKSTGTSVDTQPVIHALIASFLALGSAVNEETLQRAGNNLRDLIYDPQSRLSPAAIRILEDILVGVDYQ